MPDFAVAVKGYRGTRHSLLLDIRVGEWVCLSGPLEKLHSSQPDALYLHYLLSPMMLDFAIAVKGDRSCWFCLSLLDIWVGEWGVAPLLEGSGVRICFPRSRCPLLERSGPCIFPQSNIYLPFGHAGS